MAMTWTVTNIAGVILGSLLLLLGLGFKLPFFPKVRKKDQVKTAGFALLAVFLVFGAYMNVIPNFLGGFSLPSGGGAPPASMPPATIPGVSACGDDQLATLFARAEDVGASTLTYYASVMYLLDGDTRTGYSITGGTSAPGYGNATNIPCGVPYTLVGVTSAGTHCSVAPRTVTLNKEWTYEEFEGCQLSKAQILVKDETDAKRYESADNAIGSNTTGFVDLNTTLIHGTASATDISVGTDGQIDDKIYIKAATANKYFVEPDMPMFICVDTGTDGEWAEPSITFEGHRLSSDGALAAMNDDDLTGSLVSSAEWCYKVPPSVHQGIGDTQKEILFRIKARSGQDPDTSNDDITISFLGVGRYLSSKAPIIEEGIYTDGSSQTLVVSDSAEVPKIVYQIS